MERTVTSEIGVAVAPSRCLRRLRVVIRGAVQGVGFRPFVYRVASEMELPGWVLNSAQGVFIEVDGEEASLQEFLVRIAREKPAIAHIQSMESSWLDPAGFPRFEIRESAGGEKTTLILPDLATCPDCLQEIQDPTDRRYRYPFTNCTNCGPRFSIIESLPYDRVNTTMKKFAMCGDCEREYHRPSDRRFHAQPNACPACGPHLELWDASGEMLESGEAALKAAAEAVRRGLIVAIKGLGGFHFVTDAGNEDAVVRLRHRKLREEKPFALMYPSFAQVARDCQLSAVEERLLRSPESPIVLLRRRDARTVAVADSVAPGNPYLGVMLPYTPLHHLLLSDLGFPVVATSGNLSDEPICTDECEALRRLRGIADLFLVHNRPILRHVDDSIVREVGGRELVLRRARGFAPLPVPLQGECPSLLAFGAHQKNTIAASVGRQVFISQHIGDLETAQALQAFQHVIGTFRLLYELRPSATACDLHPGYFSTQYATRNGEPVSKVQHHYAHVLSCMAENELQPPVLGISWDGTGYGTDGTIWGGEFLTVGPRSFTRVAHLRTFRLPGGEKAVREPRRVALGLLYEIFGAEAFDMLQLEAVRAFSSAELRILRGMLEKRLNSPLTSSAGRLFDAVSSLTGLRQVCSFEGQAAMELELAVGAAVAEGSYPFRLRERHGCIILDWEPMVRAVVEQPDDPAVARKFHHTLARMMVATAERVGESRVALTGGCFQNKHLTEIAVRDLSAAGFRPYWHQRVPPNDGGIALGQIMAAIREFSQE
jgi:hydrogenase maturation protein HypF